MFRVIRTMPNGSQGFKAFKTKKEALAWLGSEQVRQDEDEGCSFCLIELIEDKN